jgi:V/A-type H+-transporting ATPase subunit K
MLDAVTLSPRGRRVVLAVTLMLLLGGVALAQEAEGAAGGAPLAAALATGLAAIGAGIAVGIAGAAAIGAISEKPELLGRTLIFVGLAEGIVIYGLIISFIILGGG